MSSSAPLPASIRSLVVLPTYNEADNVLELSRLVLDADPSIDVLVVDDNSPDGTADEVIRVSGLVPQVRLVQHGKK